MFGKKDHISIVIEDNVLKIARVKLNNGKLLIQKVDRVTLPSPVISPKDQKPETDAFEDLDIDNVLTDDTIFGIDDKEEDKDVIDEIAEGAEEDDLGIENLDDYTKQSDDILDLDFVVET